MILHTFQAYAEEAREDWVKDWPGQIVLCTSQMYWTSEVHDALRDGTKGLRVSTIFLHFKYSRYSF